ncbi:MAG TPA: bifunctional methylenetetrahydrofolate dehydrogenase/methenyltetrahydrofolate cyclohydrolase FolD [Limnochordales bacterium]
MQHAHQSGARILDGKALAARIRQEVAAQVQALQARTDRLPGLAVLLVGDDPASAIYVRNKRRACEEAGIRSWVYHLPADTPAQVLRERIDELNAREDVHGILLQLPLPGHLAAEEFLERIDPRKDVDGFHPVNVGRLASGRPYLVPCTPAGVLALLDHAGVPLEGARAVVVGRSTIVGRPTALLLLGRNATVTICHSRTRDLPAICREADVLVAAVGRPELVKGSWLRPGAVVVDVGINRLPDGRLVGDVEFPSAQAVASAITPVPGGVGPMTVAMLLRNTLQAFRHQAGLD